MGVLSDSHEVVVEKIMKGHDLCLRFCVGCQADEEEQEKF